MRFFFVYSKKKIEEQDIVKYRKNALKYLHNRGPDGSGEDYGTNYFAFHTRLAITGDRPQPIAKNNLVILYNGEIYVIGKSILIITAMQIFCLTL